MTTSIDSATTNTMCANVSGVPRCVLLGLGQGGCAAAEYVHKHYGQGNLQLLLADTAEATEPPASASAASRRLLFGREQAGGEGCHGDRALAAAAFQADQVLFGEQLGACRLLLVTVTLGGGTGTGVLLPLVEYAAGMGLPVLVLASTPYSFEGEDRVQLSDAERRRLQELCRAFVVLPADALQGTMPAVPAVDVAFGRLALWLGEVAAGMLQPYINPLPEPPLAKDSASPAIATSKGVGAKGKMLSSKAQEQLFFSFSELSLGIFSATEPTRYNGQNLDVPTFQRRGIGIDRGDGAE